MNKETLFVWDGIMEAAEDGTLVWHGTLVANENAPDASGVEAPTRGAFDEFIASDLQFRVTGVAESLDGSKDRFKPHKITFNGGEGWAWSGKNHTDTEFELLGSLQWQGSPDKRKSLVFGRGVDEYGPFISSGWMRPGNRITLARRYLDPSDARAKWSNESIQEETLKQIYEEEDDSIVIPPWQCDAFNAAGANQ